MGELSTIPPKTAKSLQISPLHSRSRDLRSRAQCKGAVLSYESWVCPGRQECFFPEVGRRSATGVSTWRCRAYRLHQHGSIYGSLVWRIIVELIDMPQHDPEKKSAKRRVTFYRVLVCACGVVVTGLAAFGLLLHGPLTGVLIIVGLIGLSLVCAGVLTSDKTCEKLAEVIARDYD